LVAVNAAKPFCQFQTSMLRLWADNFELAAWNYEKGPDAFSSIVELNDFELPDLEALPSQTVFPAHPGADRATAEVPHDLAVVRNRWRCRSFSFLIPTSSGNRISKYKPHLSDWNADIAAG
jgi:hypothetical protein